MARPGVTYQEVVAAANQLKAQEKNPTIEQVRLLLGTGSSSTIAKYLTQWRSQQDNSDLLAAKEGLPAELVGLVKGLWQHILGQAEAKITVAEEEAAEVIDQLKQETSILLTENQRWQVQYTRLETEKEQLTHTQAALEQHIIEQKETLATLNTKQESLLQQLEEKQVHLQELRRLHQQAQENLEHYRETAREQRLLEQERHQQQVQQFEISSKQLQQNIKQLENEQIQLQHQFEKLQQEKTLLAQQNEQSTKRIEQFQIDLSKSQNEAREKSQSALHWENLCRNLQQKLDAQQKAFSDLQQTQAVSEAHISTLNTELKKAQDHLTLLAQEKWELTREKAQAEGQIKQLRLLLEKEAIA